MYSKWWLKAQKRRIEQARKERPEKRQRIEQDFHKTHVECAIELGEQLAHWRFRFGPSTEEFYQKVCYHCYSPADLIRAMLWFYSPRNDAMRTDILRHELNRAHQGDILKGDERFRDYCWEEGCPRYKWERWKPQTEAEQTALARAEYLINGGVRRIWREWWRSYRKRDDRGNPEMANPLRYLIHLAQNWPDQTQWAFGESSLI